MDASGSSAGRLVKAAGLDEAAGARLEATLEGRADIVAMTDASRSSVLRPVEAGGLDHALRATLAVRHARLHGEEVLAETYAAESFAAQPDAAMPTLADPGAAPPDDPRLAAMLRHFDLLAMRPRVATADDIEALRSAGVEEADIVRLSQLVSFLAYEVRLVAGLRLMGTA